MKLMSLCAMLLAALLVVPAAHAQRGGDESNTRAVQGTVTDNADNAVNGAVVQIKNTKTLQIRSFITKEQGAYYFHGLSPDVDYELKAEYQGVSSPSKTLSSFDNRKQALINLKLSR